MSNPSQTLKAADLPPLAPGQVRFFDNVCPALEVGDYLLNVSQEIQHDLSSNLTVVASQLFSVQGPRYSLPAEDLFSNFPPDQSQGVFDQSLPHLVLTKRELPWERNVFGDPDATQTPWLALLLFVESEGTLLAPQVDGWTPNRTCTAGIPAASLYAAHANDGICWPDLGAPEWYETPEMLASTACAVIDISPAAFNMLVPSKTDLRYLAHVRQVDPSAKDRQVLQVAGDGFYSVLVCNRLPDPPVSGAAPVRNIVHLVSLEGFEKHFDSTGKPVAPAGAQRMRMVSLESWTFECLPGLGESFAELARNLVLSTDASATPPATVPRDLRFALPVPSEPFYGGAEATYAASALANGYSPMAYETRLGEQTLAWYRGPFTPVPTANFISGAHGVAGQPNAWEPFGTASAAMIYDKTTGIFDISYAAAWEAGRLLALADGHFGRKLLDWRRNGHRLIDLILERTSQSAAWKTFDKDNPDSALEAALLDDAKSGIRSYAVTDDFMKYLVTQFSAQIAPALSGSGIAASPFPPYPLAPSPVPTPQKITELLALPPIQNVIRSLGGEETETLADWLAQKYLLTGVPFENLVPHPGFLPVESLRFFYLDPNWLAALLEGALSIGIESSRDRLYQDLMKDILWITVLSAVQQVRDTLLRSQAATVPSGAASPLDQEAMTGMLLRSSLVSGFPGLQVNAYASTLAGSSLPDRTKFIPLLRSEKLATGVLLCLWPTVPAVVCIEEPHEGVAFGFEDPPHGVGDMLYLRSLDTATYGQPMCTDAQQEGRTCNYQIDGASVIGSNRVINISGTGGLLQQMSKLLPGAPAVAVHNFALQMIKVPEQIVIAVPAHAAGERQGQHNGR